MLQSAILVFDGVEELDFIGPWEILKAAEGVCPGSVAVKLISKTLDALRAANGLRFYAEETLASAALPGLLILPGGQGRRAAMKDAEILGFVRRTAEAGEIVASVCTGAFVLAEAGLLSGKSATTHASAMDELRGYPDISVLEERVVRNGNILTAAGVSAGMDMALEVLARAVGGDVALAAAAYVEYESPYLEKIREFVN